MPRPEFDWQIGGDSWEDVPATRRQDGAFGADLRDTPVTERAVEQARRHRLSLPIVLLILGMASVAALLAVGQRVNETTQAVEQDILAAHEAVQHAVSQSDVELFTSLLSRSNPVWRIDYQRLFEQGALFDRRPLGLRPQAVDPRIVDVTLSPDLKEAEVVAEHAYTVDADSGLTQTVRLQQTFVYRLDVQRQRWLLDAPAQDFWGDSITSEGRFVTLVYPERDEQISRRLARDLDTVLDSLCASLSDTLCPLEPVTLRFQTQLSSLVEMLQQVRRTSIRFNSLPSHTDIILPTPSLLGTPTDGVGYQALYRAYAVQAVRAILDQNASLERDWRIRPFYEAMLNRELIRWGLRAWPLTVADRAQNPSPIPLPDQDIELFCVENMKQGSTLHRYDPASDVWSVELTNRIFTSMIPLPEGSGVILHEQTDVTNEALTRIVFWQDGKERVLFDNLPNRAPIRASGSFDPSGRYLVVYSQPGPSSNSERYYVLDLERCSASGCKTREIAGWPIWSPGGAQTILQRFESASDMLYRGDAQGQSIAEIGEGQAPFWLDDATYGYVRQVSGARTSPAFELIIATARDDDPQVIIRSDDLLAGLPDHEAPTHVNYLYATPQPADANMLLITMYGFDSTVFSPDRPPQVTSLIFLFDRRTGQISRLFRTKGFASGAVFSPDGQWILIGDQDPDSPASTIMLHALNRDYSERLNLPPVYGRFPFASTTFDWSADGQWLLALGDGVLRLIAPGHNYRRTIVPPSPGCISAAWVNR